jgi:hypothetical protein
MEVGFHGRLGANSFDTILPASLFAYIGELLAFSPLATGLLESISLGLADSNPHTTF